MLLSELTFPRSIYKAGVILGEYGYKKIGGALYGAVFHKPGESSVLKLFDTNDIAYIAFVEVCREHQSNPHFPRFSKSTLRIKDTEYSAIRTELLKQGDTSLLRKLSLYFKVLSQLSNETDAVIEDDLLHYFVRVHHLPLSVANQGVKDYSKWVKKADSLYKAFNIIINELSDPRFRFDLHKQNMMMRGDTVVIIDPVAPRDYHGGLN